MNDIKDMKPEAWVIRLRYSDRWSGEMLTDVLPENRKDTFQVLRALYAEAQMKELADRLEKCADAERICDSYADENQRLHDRATTAEAAIAEAQKVIDLLSDELSPRALRAARTWLEANKGDGE